MKLLKKYKWIILVFFTLCLIFPIMLFKDLFLAQDGALYGNRLEGIKSVPISDELKKEISDFILEVDGIKKVSNNIHGKIFNIVILVDETVMVDKVKELSKNVLAKFSTAQTGFYDISFLIDYTDESEKTDFPLIGYKNKNSDDIVW